MRRLLTVIAHVIYFCVVCGASAALSVATNHHGGGPAGRRRGRCARPRRRRTDESTLGQPIIIENLGGAGGTLSVARVVRSPPDGYTLGLGTVGQYVISGAVYTVPYDLLTIWCRWRRCPACRTG